MEYAWTKLNTIIKNNKNNTTALETTNKILNSPWYMARMSNKYASQPNDSQHLMVTVNYYRFMIHRWVEIYFQTRHCISAGALLFLGGKTLHEITWFYEDKINIWNLSSKMTSNCVSLTSGTLLHSQERPFLYKKAFLEVGSSITYLPFTKHCLAKIYPHYRYYFYKCTVP